MSVNLTEAQKEEARVTAKQQAELLNIEYVDPYPPTQQQPNQPNDIPVDLTDDAILEIVKKRTGATLTSLNDLKPKPTAEELAAQQKEREDKMLAYGLTASKFTKEEYDGYQGVLANKMAFIKADITEQLTSLNPELSPEAINEKVAQYLFEHLDPTDSLRVAREKELLALAGIKINDKFKNIVNLPSDYAQHEEGLNNKVTFDRKVEAIRPVYTADVNTALESLRTFTVPIPDTKNPANSVTVDLSYDDQDLKEVADVLLSNEQLVKAAKEGYTPAEIKEIADLMLWKKHGPRLISQAAKKYNATQKGGYIAGRKGLSALDSVNVHDDKLNDSIDDVYEQLINSSEPAKN